MSAEHEERTHATDRMRTLLAVLIIATCGVIAYSNTLSAPFHFDDFSSIQVNPLIQNTEFLFAPSEYCSHVSPQSIDYVTCYFFKQRYIGYLSFAGNYLIHGLQVQGYHIVNLGIHILNGILVYFLVLLIFRTPGLSGSSAGRQAMPVALFASLLFITHPIQTQAVTYIVQRFTSLAALFYLLALASYLKSRLSPSPASRYCWYAGSLVCIALAMKTKEIAFTLPLMIVLFEFGFFEGSIKARLRRIIPILLTMLIIPVGAVSIDRPLQQIMDEIGFASRVKTDMPRVHYLYTQFPVILTYMRLIFLPIRQNLDYDFPVYHSFFIPRVLVSFCILAAVLALGAYFWHRSRKGDPALRLVSVGIFFFFIALSVESSFIPIVDVIFEHRVYLPSVGAFLAIAVSILLLAKKLESLGKPGGKVFVAASAVIILALTAGTLKRNMVWQDEVSLWGDVVEKSPGKARGYNNLGYFYMRKGGFEKAIDLFNKTLQKDPNYLQAYNNLGNIYLNLRQFDKAVESFTRSIEINPGYADIYNNRGNAYMGLNQFEKAVADYSQSIALLPIDPDYYYNRGLTRVKMKEYDKAIADFSNAVALNPNHSRAILQRGVATYIASRDFARAVPDFQRACELGNRIGCEILRAGPEPRKAQ